MNFGEKIQLYRKNHNMSQEELGQKLFVSRQTVSLWEKGQTAPTIENLIRLGEIFSVTVDELLGGEGAKPEAEIASEAYKFKFSPEEIREMLKNQGPLLYSREVSLLLIGGLGILLCALLRAQQVLLGLIIGAVLVGFTLSIRGIRAYKRMWRQNQKRICECTYEYKIFDKCFVADILKNGEIKQHNRLYFSDIEKITPLEKHLLLQCENRIFIIRKNELAENSFFSKFMEENPQKVAGPSMPLSVKLSSWLLFIFTVTSPLLAATVVELMVDGSAYNLQNMWVFFLFVPISAASIIYGFIVQKRGYGVKKNIIAGFIVTALLCAYGAFAFLSL